MKKSIFLCLTLLALLLGNSVKAQDNEPLTFGVISDIHFGNGMGVGPMVKVPQALKNLTSQGKLDVLAVVGDLANSGSASEYEQLVGVFQDEANFTTPVGSFLFMMGNHDNFNSNGKANYQEGLKAFNGGEPYPFHIYKVVKGYPFITISEFSGDSNDTGSAAAGNNAYPAESIAFLEQSLERASQECPGKPIFVFTHVPPRWTVYGAWPEFENGSAWCMKVLNPVLNRYPQAVVFAGHSHYPLGDPRSIHQGVNPQSSRQNYYTVINTASTTYSEVAPGEVTAGIHPENYADITEGLILTELPNGDIEVRRYDTFRNTEIGADARWVLKAPFDGSMFQYGDLRDADDNPDNRPLRDGGTAPVFADGAALSVKTSAFRAVLSIPQATDDECVFRYRIRVSKGGLVIAEKYVFSQHYLNGDMPQTLHYSINALEASADYAVEVVAMDSYGNMSAPLTQTFTTPAPGTGGSAPDARWTFDDPTDLLKVEEGDIQMLPISVGRKSVQVVDNLEEVGITAIPGRNDSDGAVFVPVNAGFKVVRTLGTTTQDYTILMDIKMEDTNPYNALYQTNASNTNDGDLFINKRKIGINVNGLGYHGDLEDDTWYRIAILNRDGDFCVYVDGELVGHTSSQGCWELDPWGFFLFCDEDGEMNDTYVSEISFWEYGLSESEVQALSGIEPQKEDPFVNVLTESVKIVDELEFNIVVEANVAFSFILPDWVEGIDVTPFAGTKTYTFRALPMESEGRRTDYISIQAEGLPLKDVLVEQVHIGDNVPEPIGRWTFNDPTDLLKGIGQSALYAAFQGESGPEITDDLESLGLEPVAGPTDENGALHVPGGSFLWLAANAGSEKLTSFSILFDLNPCDLVGYKSLFQNDITNRADAGLFIKDNTIGRGGASTNLGYVGDFDSDRWYRIIFVVQDSRARLYIDGENIRESPQPHDFWDLLGDALLFADNDGEVGPLDVADIRLWDFALSDKLASQLGNVYSDEEELFVVMTSSVRLIDETDFTITVNANVPVTFDLPEWIEAVDVEPFEGEKAYAFRAQPMEEEGRRTDVVIIETDFFQPEEVEVTQIKLGDTMPEPIGVWTFDNASDLMAGSSDAIMQAAYRTDEGIVVYDDPAEANISATAGPTSDNGAINIPADACLYIANQLGIEQLNDFTILFDVRPATLQGWNALYQRDATNKTDACLFIKEGLIGVNEAGISYHGDVMPDKWHRILFVVKAGTATIYLNGDKIAQSTRPSTRWAMLPDLLLFMDNDGETKDNDVAEIRIWDVPLNESNAKELGGVTQEWEETPLPDPTGFWSFDNPADPFAGTGTASLHAAVFGANGPVLVDDWAAAGFEPIAGPSGANGALTVPIDCYLQLARNEDGDLNSFSILMDIRPKSLSGFNALFQSHVNNEEDGSLYTSGTRIGLNMNGLGYGGELVEGAWHRIVFVVNENRMSAFIDGIKVIATSQTNTDRWILHETGLIFADDNGEEGTVDVAELAFWDVALNSDQVKELGDVSNSTDIDTPRITPADASWTRGIFDISGRRLNSMPAAKGLYIIDGKKVVVR